MRFGYVVALINAQGASFIPARLVKHSDHSGRFPKFCAFFKFLIDHPDHCDQGGDASHGMHPGDSLGLQHIQRASKSVGDRNRYEHCQIAPGTKLR